jgi:hypothetical protein
MYMSFKLNAPTTSSIFSSYMRIIGEKSRKSAIWRPSHVTAVLTPFPWLLHVHLLTLSLGKKHKKERQ